METMQPLLLHCDATPLCASLPQLLLLLLPPPPQSPLLSQFNTTSHCDLQLSSADILSLQEFAETYRGLSRKIPGLISQPEKQHK